MASTPLLTVNLYPKLYPNHVTQNTINYKGSLIELTESEVETYSSLLPSYWTNEKDKLVKFVAFEDGSYYCEKYKEVFNYTTRDTEGKFYIFNAAPVEEATKLLEISLRYFNEYKLNRVDDFYSNVIDSIGDLSYLKYSLLETREKLLSASDHKFLSDYKFSSEEEKQKWETYRQKLRDITETEEWKNCDFVNLSFPVSPAPTEQLYTMGQKLADYVSQLKLPSDIMQKMQDEYANKSTAEIAEKFVQISVKAELLMVLSRLKMPMFDIDMSGLALQPSFDESNIPVDGIIAKDYWDLMTSNISEKIDRINTQLDQSGIDFSINDLLMKMVEDMKNQSDIDAANQSTMELIYDLQTEGGEV